MKSNYEKATKQALKAMAIATMTSEAMLNESKKYKMEEMNERITMLNLECALENRQRSANKYKAVKEENAVFASC